METPPTGEPSELAAVSELALLLAELDPTAAARLQIAHTADTSGRCRVCRSVWPCTLYAVGRDAGAHARTTRLPGR